MRLSRLRRSAPRLLSALVALAASACQSVVDPAVREGASARPACDRGAVRLTQDFPGAPRSDCTRLGPARFELRIEPEARPINPSPWYAFDLHRVSGAPQSEAEVILNYAAARHRYAPRRRTAQGWALLGEAAVTLLDKDERRASVSISLPDPGGDVRIAAQEVLPAAERRAWREAYAARTDFELVEIGRSVQGRPIEALRRPAARPDAPVIIVLGGQHPPEVPGVLGHRAFLDQLDDADARRPGALDAVHWLVIPALNPDGADAGHWRLNAGLVDLNRDWGPFTQPETRAAQAAIEAALDGAGPSLILLDFHATRRDVLYVPEGTGAAHTDPLVERLIDALNAALPAGENTFDVSPGYAPGRPTAKTWFYETYGRPGVTVEFGDDTDRGRIERLAGALASAVVGLAEATPRLCSGSARSAATVGGGCPSSPQGG